MKTKVMVAKQAWEALHEAYKAMCAADPDLEKRWLDQCVTSAATHDVGWADLVTDHDWLVLFFAWHSGGQIPRERPQRRHINLPEDLSNPIPKTER